MSQFVPRNPPPEQPIRTYPSPDITDQVVLEWVTSELAASAPVEPGTAHPNTRDFSGFKFGKQVVNPTDHNFFIRYYVKDQPSPDTFTPAWNYALKYSGQSNSAPILIRAYRKLKSGYTPLAKGTALADYPAAYLVEEEAQQFPIDSEFYALYFNVVRVYETLPGPYLPANRYDADLGVITGRRRAVVNSSQAAAVTTSHSLRYEARDGSSIVSWEIEESWDNTAFPINKTDFNDPERGPIHQVSQITTDTTTAGSSPESGGVVTTTRYEPYQDNPALRKKIIETWSVPWTRTSKKTNAKKQVVTVTETREAATTTPATPTATKDVDFKVVGDGTAIETSETVPSVFDADTRSIEIPDVTPAWAKALLPTTNTSSEAAATSVSDPTLSTGQIRKRVQRTTEKTVQTEITARDTASLPKTRTNKKLMTDYGGALVDDVQTQATGTQTPSSGGLLVVDSEVEVLGDGTSVLSTKTAEGSEWPTLDGTKVDENLRIAIPYTKKVVAAGATGGVSGSVLTEVQPLDKWRSITIASTIPDDLSSLNETYPTVVNHIFPDTVTAASLVNTWSSAFNADNASYSYDLALKYTLLAGYRGPCDGQIIETYTTSPDTSSYPVTKFFPQEYLVTSAFTYYYTSTSNVHTQARIFQFRLPLSLHDEIDLTPSTPSDGSADGDTVPATDPVALPSPGTLITVDRQSERWRFGIWRNRVTQIYVP